MSYVHGKIVELEDISLLVSQLRESGQKIVLCHGVFDLIHLGHIRYLNAAKKFGDVLVVTLTADKYVKRGPGRPVFNEALRAEALANLTAVDFVSVVHAPTALEAIDAVRPDFYAKGADYKVKDSDITKMIYEEENAVEAVGGKLVFTDEITFSSSQLINNYLDTYPGATARFLRDLAGKYSADYVISSLQALASMKVLVIGDAIIDQYYYCTPLGKSAKENIVVNRYLSKEHFAGGALATANHVAQLSENVDLVTIIGEKNSFADLIEQKLDPRIRKHLFTRTGCLTTVKRRFVTNEAKKLFEICYLDDHPLNPHEEEPILQFLKDNLDRYDLVVLNDFGHGMLTPNLMDLLCRRSKCLALNVQTNSANIGFNLVTKYSRADLICIDEQELRFATHDRHGDLPTLVNNIYDALKPRQILVTRGADGSLSYTRNGDFHETPAFTSSAVDKVGAGDAFFAYASPCFAAGLPDDLVGFVGNVVGALAVQIVCNREPVRFIDVAKFVTRLLNI